MLYGSWLKANAGASGSARIFSSYFRLEQDFPTLLEACRQFLVTGHGLPGAGDQFIRIARLFELSGRIEQARDSYLGAYAEGAPGSALISAFLLSLEMNDAESIAKSLGQLKGRGEPAASILETILALKMGDDASARATLLGLARASSDPELSLKALWVLYATATSKSDPRALAEARAGMAARFPGAPETAMATASVKTDALKAGPSVLQFPTPDAFAGPQAAPQSAPPPTSDPQSATPAAAPVESPSVSPAVTPSGTRPALAAARYSVQAGSFQVRENADYLAADLAKVGFSPIVTKDTVQGKDLFRVLAGTRLDDDQARALLSRLSDAGFSGFRIAEK